MTRKLLLVWLVGALFVCLSCSSSSSGDDTHADTTGDVVEDLTVDVPGDDMAEDLGTDEVSPEDTVEVAEDDLTELVPDDIQPDETGPVDLPFPELTVRPGVVFELQTETPVSPFPWNWFLVPDDTTRTGKRLSFDAPAAMSGIFHGVFGMSDAYRPDLEMLDSFGAMAFLMLPFATEMDPETLPDSTGADTAIRVYRLTQDGVEAVVLDVSYETYNDMGGNVAFNMVQMLPRVPLEESSRYLVAVMRTLPDAAGNTLEPYPLAEVLMGVREPYGPVAMQERMTEEATQTQAAIDAAGLSTDDLAAAWLFDVGTMESDMFQAREHLDQAEVEYNLDPDGDGNINLTTAAESSLFGNDENVAWVLEGEFRAVDFRNQDGIIIPDSDGNIEPTGHYWRPFYLLIPAASSDGTVPIISTQHGLNSAKEQMLSMGRHYASHGIASAGFDFLHHKKGTEGGWKFVIIEELLKSRDNFRQSALDYYQFVRTLKTLNENEDLVEDGLPDFNFDRYVFTGHSLGAIESTVTAALYRDNALCGLVNGGGNLQYLMEGFLKAGGLYDIAPGDVIAGFKAMGGQLMSQMDPAVFAKYLQQRVPEDAQPVPYLLVVATEDDTVYPECGYALARALGSSLLDPCLLCWDNLPLANPADVEFGTIQLTGGHTTFFGGSGMAPEVRAITYNYVSDYVLDGTLSITWPPASFPTQD